MQAGLERTSGRNYGRWVISDNWVQSVLNRPFVEEVGGLMQYSTGNTHLLSAILMQESKTHTYRLANRWLAGSGVRIESWGKRPARHSHGWQPTRYAARITVSVW